MDIDLRMSLAVDVYSFGIMLWELWFRMVPYADTQMSKIVSHVKRGKRLPFIDLPDEMPLSTSLKILICLLYTSDAADE